jgi:cell division transport system ATP-binding protein
MIKFEDVSKGYEGEEVLTSLNFHLHQGEMAFLTGPSGAGKSTILKLIALIERVNQGQIFLDGQLLTKMKDSEIPFIRRKMGIVFQNARLLFDRSIFNNVALPLVILGVPHREMGRRVRAALDKVGLLHREKSFPISLSSGEQQRINIARAIVHKPQLLLADEPTGNLDPELSQDIFYLFEQFNQVGVSLLIASHDVDLINRLPYRCLQLNQRSLYERIPQEDSETI